MSIIFHNTKPTDETVIQHAYGKRIKNFIYNIKDQVGKGFSSVVYRGINELNRQEIAVKVIELSKIKNEVQKYLLNNQMRVLRKLNHPNILKCLDILMTKNNAYIVTEFCKKGDLLSIVKKNGRLAEHQALRWAKDIVEGYLCIEDNKILHRDIKTANIFIGSDDVARIADFGFSEFIGEPKPSIPYNVGSPAYMSPESYQQSYYSPQSDLWSIGIIIYEMLVGQVPFKKCEYGELVRNLINGNLGIPQNIQVSDGTRRILIGCFKQKLNQRLTAHKLHQLITQQLSITARSNPRMIDNNGGEFRRSIVTTNNTNPSNNPSTANLNTRSSGMFQQITRSSQIHQILSNKNGIIQGINSYLNFLFRLGRMLNQNKMTIVKSLIYNIFCISNRNRLELVSQGDVVISQCDPDFKRDYQIIKTRILEVAEFNERNEPIDPNLRLLSNTPFKSEQNITGSINYLKFCVREFDKLLDTETKYMQNLGCILDYLINYIEILQLQLVTNSIVEVAKTGKLLVNIKDRPVNLSQAHIKLIRYKRKILGI